MKSCQRREREACSGGGEIRILSESLHLWASVAPIFSIRKLAEALGAARVGEKPTTLPPLSHFIFLLSLSFSKEFFNVISNLSLKTSFLLVGRVGMHGELDREASFCWSLCQRLKEWAALLERVLTFGHKMAAFSQPTLLSQTSLNGKQNLGVLGFPLIFYRLTLLSFLK